MRRGIAPFVVLRFAPAALAGGIAAIALLALLRPRPPARMPECPPRPAVLMVPPFLPPPLVARPTAFTGAAREFRERLLAPQNLPGARLTGCRLVGDWRGHSLRDALLAGCDLTKAALDDATAAQLRVVFAGESIPVDFRGCSYDPLTRWPAGFDPHAAGARLKGGRRRQAAALAPRVFVATIAPRDAERAGDALQRAGIPALIEGSVADGIQVARAHRERALAVLKRDAVKHGYWLRVVP